MALPDDVQVFMTVDTFQEAMIPGSKSQSKLFVNIVKDTITIEINKPATDSSVLAKYLAAEIENAIAE